MEWKSYGRRRVYDSPYVEVWLDDVEIPGVGRIDHHVVTMPKASVTSVVTDEQGRFLLLYRHRFITDHWGWEVPAGWAEPGEDPAVAISREIEEETGWRPASVTPLVEYDALAGISTMRFQCFHATACEQIGAPIDGSEATRVEWMPESELLKLLATGQVQDGPSLAALSYFLGPHRLLSSNAR
ncbi:NUDIX hydrolase [Kitasatospora sp. GAS204B]|uniref:NUDIX hydrolase n=1 Tax=unclassified Kitasatospora TaxID=2633591 RepID=UPI002475F862|nr:NUDIX hydrolase [Kitasatospora sp. GAS204B]MDH6117243.1 8-oxo-dGTP pyrophosphatase MutT (NUDIX family) [Kitasatospora sp. GAS204B]